MDATDLPKIIVNAIDCGIIGVSSKHDLNVEIKKMTRNESNDQMNVEFEITVHNIPVESVIHNGSNETIIPDCDNNDIDYATSAGNNGVNGFAFSEDENRCQTSRRKFQVIEEIEISDESDDDDKKESKSMPYIKCDDFVILRENWEDEYDTEEYDYAENEIDLSHRFPDLYERERKRKFRRKRIMRQSRGYYQQDLAVQLSRVTDEEISRALNGKASNILRKIKQEYEDERHHCIRNEELTRTDDYKMASFSRKFRVHHQILIGAGKFECQSCGRRYIQEHNLTKHIQTVHREDNYRCKICAAIFTERSQIINHVNRFHLSNKSHWCDDCKRKYDIQCDRRFKKLKKYDVDDSYECESCGKQFTN